MSAPIQGALPAWLGHRAGIQAQIRHRLQANLATLDAILLRQTLVNRLAVEAGWYAVLRVPGCSQKSRLRSISWSRMRWWSTLVVFLVFPVKDGWW